MARNHELGVAMDESDFEGTLVLVLKKMATSDRSH